MTKDEKFLVALYRTLHGKVEATCNPQHIAKELGLSEHIVYNVLKHLMKANLVKRYSPDEIGLTDRGLTVAESLTK